MFRDKTDNLRNVPPALTLLFPFVGEFLRDLHSLW